MRSLQLIGPKARRQESSTLGNGDYGPPRIIVMGLGDLAKVRESPQKVAVEAMLLAGVRDTDMEDASYILRNVKSVGVLNLSDTPIRDLRVFTGDSYGITILDLSDTTLAQEQINYVANIDTLRELKINSNRSVKNIDFVEALKRLTTLNIGYTEVTDLAPIVNLRKLEYLNVANLNLRKTTVEILTHVTSLKEVDVSYSSIDIELFPSVVYARLFRITYAVRPGVCRAIYPGMAYQAMQNTRQGEWRGIVMNDKIDGPLKFAPHTPKVVEWTVVVRPKTRNHPLFNVGSPNAYMIVERGEENFGQPLVLDHGTVYKFMVRQRTNKGNSRVLRITHPFFIDYEQGGGQARFDNGIIAPRPDINGRVSGVVNGDLYFKPNFKDGRILYAECEKHEGMGFILKVNSPKLYSNRSSYTAAEICSLCKREVAEEDVDDMIGCETDPDTWYCSEQCAEAGLARK